MSIVELNTVYVTKKSIALYLIKSFLHYRYTSIQYFKI